MGDVVLRTHGGLGNQLFQILYGRLWAEQEGAVLREVHDGRYQHRFERASPSLIADETNVPTRIDHSRVELLSDPTLAEPVREPLLHGVYFDLLVSGRKA